MTKPLITIATPLKAVLLKRKGVTLGVWGEAGIGKSYALRETLRNLACQTLSLHSATPLSTLAKTLAKPKKLPLWTERTLARLENSESVEEASALAALGALFAGLAPFVLHLEDSHEADNERLELIQKLARMIRRSKGVGLVITSRTEPPEPFLNFRLEPLTKEQSDTLLETQVAATLPKEALEWLYDKAAGNPLYTLEYFRLLSRQGTLWSDGKSWNWRKPEGHTMPVTVEALIELLLFGVNQDPKLETALQAKALLPLETEDELWAKVAELSTKELEEAKLEFRQRGIFSSDTFAHPLYREVTLKHLPKTKRHHLAKRILEVLNDEPMKAAPFIDEAGLDNIQALEVIERAVQKALKTGALAWATQLRAKSVDYLTGETQATVAYETAYDLYDYNLAGAIHLLQLAHRIRPTDHRILRRLVSWLAQVGRRGEVENALATLPETERSSVFGLTMMIEAAHYLQDADHVLELWDAHPELYASLTPTTIRNVAFSMADLGHSTRAIHLASQTLNLSHLSVEERVLLLETCGFAYYTKSDFVAAAAYYTEAIDLFRANGQASRVGSLLFNRAMTLQGLARFSESLADAKEAHHLASESGHALFYAHAQLALGIVALEQGDCQKAEELLLECKQYYEHNGIIIFLLDVGTALSDLYRDWPIPHAGVLARKYAEQAVLVARQAKNVRYIANALPTLVLAEAQFGKAKRALDLSYEIYHVSQTDVLLFAKLHRARATALLVLGQPNEAKLELQQALKLLEQKEAPLETQRIGLELDRLNNDIESARKRVQWFEERGLLNSVNIAKRYFPELATVKDESISETAVPRLNVLGTMQMSRDGKAENVRGRKRQEFLALLLESRLAGRSEVGRLELLDTLYPDEDELKALQNLKSLIYTLRSSLGETSILTTNTGYQLGAMKSDAEEFLESGDTSLWRGVYLEDIETSARESVGESLYLVLFEKAKDLLETDSREAVRVAQFLLLADPYNASYLALNVRALRARDNYKTLKRIYSEARKRLADVGESLPENWLDFLELTDKTPSNLSQI